MKCPLYAKTYKEFVTYRNEQRKRNYAQTQTGDKKGWTTQHDALVLQHSITDRELSEQIGHSVQAIQIRRCRLRSELQ